MLQIDKEVAGPFAASAAKYYPALKSLRPNKVFRLSAAFIEAAHDFGIEQTWPAENLLST